MERRRTLRQHAFLIALAVLLSPLLLVMSTNWIESLFGDRTIEHVENSAAGVARELKSGGLEKAQVLADKAAQRWSQRVRIVNAVGETKVDANRLVGDGALFVAGDIFYGPERKTVLGDLDREIATPAQRFDAAQLAQHSRTTGCSFITAGNLFMCHTAQIAVNPSGEKFAVLVEGSSRRALHPLYESRRQLLKLLFFAAALGVVLAWWTVRWFVRPVEALRTELLARAARAAPEAVALPKASGPLGRPREVKELTDAFNAVLHALSERNKTNEAFLQDLAHEFKNPVAAVRASAERLCEPGPLDDERRARLADVLKQSSVQLDSLVTQFLELARAEAGLPDEAREKVDVGQHLSGLVSMMSRDPRYERVKFDVAEAGVPLLVQGVPQRIDVALRNLLENAASFAGDGGWVKASARAEGTEAIISISDSGPGIPHADLPRLFDRFFTRRGDRHGTGLGLALTRAVVHAHQGRVEVKSPPGSGATFTVALPFTNDSHASS